MRLVNIGILLLSLPMFVFFCYQAFKLLKVCKPAKPRNSGPAGGMITHLILGVRVQV
jgi:hypothetical protein